MKKLSRFVLIAALFGMVSCGANVLRADARKEIDFSTLESNDFTPTTNKATLGTFDLISPMNGAIGEKFVEFTWGACENADTYMLEVCSSDLFISDISGIDYYSKNNITTTTFKVNASFTLESVYYWRVFAFNDGEEKRLSTSTFTFQIKSKDVDEVEFPVGNADDWRLHSDGSVANISIDESNFFDNDKESVVVEFNAEDLAKGPSWVIVTKSVEKNTYGTDAFYLNLYYAGQQDAVLFLRVLDRDSEYWHIKVQIANNAKQTLILRFDEFTLRTKDVDIHNEKFDYDRIKDFEIVFEDVRGDGLLMLSDIKTVKFENYKSYFVDKLNFSSYEESSWTFENYNFDLDKTEDELTLNFYDSSEEGKPVFNGYGFAKVNLNRRFVSGDSVKVSVKASGGSYKNIIIRVYEEDTDRWSYKIPLKSIELNEYKTFVIPYKAFAKSAIQGDGKRQFSYILNLQFGLEGASNPTAGSLSFKDFEIVKLADYKEEGDIKKAQADGLIEDFDEYKYTCDMYYYWDCTEQNKDEYMNISSEEKVGKGNAYSGRFEYKADMADAIYTLPLKCEYTGFTSFNFFMKDASIRSSDEKFSYLDNVNPDIFINLNMSNGKIYQYIMVAVKGEWYQYEISFKDFYLANGTEIGQQNIDAKDIESINFSIKYYYFDYYGKPSPTYMDDNVIYMDNLAFGHASETSEALKEEIIHTDENGVAMVEDFENYDTTQDMEYYWYDGRTYSYQHKELSNDVSPIGGNHSGKLKFLAKNESPSYYVSPTIGSDVTSRGIKLSFKCDVKATVYVNFYIKLGTTTMQYRATLNSVELVWTEYKIGLANFTDVNKGSRPFTYRDIINIYRISIGVT